MKENKNIGDLFKDRLGSYEDDFNIDQEWNEIELKLHKLNFFRFSLSNFNIYYCSIILASFLLTSTVFVKAFIFDGSISHTPESSISANDSLIIDKSLLKTDWLLNVGEESYSKDISDEKANKSNSHLAGNKEGSDNKKELINKNTRPEDRINPLDENKNHKNNNPVNNLSSNNASNNSDNSENKENNINGKSLTPNINDNHSTAITSQDKNDITNKNPEEAGNTDKTINNKAHLNFETTNPIQDNLNMPRPVKKNVVYITKQDTIEVFDTLRRKKPFKRK
jgi:hypothetical protein